jgi:hypothetical protein
MRTLRGLEPGQAQRSIGHIYGTGNMNRITTTGVRRFAQLLLLALLAILIAGCTTTPLRNNVTAFNTWPNDLDDKTYAIERTAEQANDLEFQTYENMLRAELARHGFEEQPVANARLSVKLQYKSSVRDVQVYQPVAEPYAMPWGWGGGAFGCQGPQGYYPPGIYYPGCGAPPIVQQQATRYQMYARHVRVWIADAKTKRNLFDVTVNGDDSQGPLPEMMPYMLRAAFSDFPGQNGVPRVVEYKLDKKAQPARP